MLIWVQNLWRMLKSTLVQKIQTSSLLYACMPIKTQNNNSAQKARGRLEAGMVIMITIYPKWLHLKSAKSTALRISRNCHLIKSKRRKTLRWMWDVSELTKLIIVVYSIGIRLSQFWAVLPLQAALSTRKWPKSWQLKANHSKRKILSWSHLWKVRLAGSIFRGITWNR